MAPNMHILIIGAGSTGLLIAQGLKRASISFEVFEREDVTTYRDRARIWTMALHWGRPFIAKVLPPELYDRLQLAETDPTLKMTHEQETSVPILNGKTGETMKMMPTDSSRKVNRTKLRALFAEGIDVQYGKKAASFTDDGNTVGVTFSDGSTATGTMVVGCDSTKSALRSYLLKPEHNIMEPHPILVWNYTQSFTAEQARYIRSFYHPTMQLYFAHPDQRTRALVQPADIVDPDQPETWIYQIIMSVWGTDEYPAENAGRVQLFKQLSANYCEPLRSIGEWLTEDVWISPDKYAYWQNPTPWDNHGGKMTLAGDSAHPMAPFRAQGLNNAVQDACYYVEAVKSIQAGETTMATAVSAYDKEVFERGSKEIAISAKQAYADHHFDAWATSTTAKSGIVKLESGAMAVEARR